MNTIYVVTAGEYSDYRIMAAFSTREGAQAYIDAWPLAAACIEEYPVDAPPEHKDLCAKENCDGFCNNEDHSINKYTVPFGRSVFGG